MVQLTRSTYRHDHLNHFGGLSFYQFGCQSSNTTVRLQFCQQIGIANVNATLYTEHKLLKKAQCLFFLQDTPQSPGKQETVCIVSSTACFVWYMRGFRSMHGLHFEYRDLAPRSRGRILIRNLPSMHVEKGGEWQIFNESEAIAKYSNWTDSKAFWIEFVEAANLRDELNIMPIEDNMQYTSILAHVEFSSSQIHFR